MKEPLSNAMAKTLVVAILAEGELAFTGHALHEMAADDLNEVDVRNTLRGGVCRLVEFEHGSWRYRFETRRLVAVVAFRAERHAVVVTAWRL